MLSKTIPTDSSCYNDSEKVQFDLSSRYRFVVIEEKVKGQVFGSSGVKQINMLHFCWQKFQNAHQVNTIKKKRIVYHMWDASLLWLRSEDAQPMNTNETCYIW